MPQPIKKVAEVASNASMGVVAGVWVTLGFEVAVEVGNGVAVSVWYVWEFEAVGIGDVTGEGDGDALGSGRTSKKLIGETSG